MNKNELQRSNNRIDESIVFHTLAKEHLEKIEDIQLAPLKPFMTDEQRNEQKKKLLEQYKTPSEKIKFLQQEAYQKEIQSTLREIRGGYKVRISNLKEGDYVLVKNGSSGKLELKWKGPFLVTKIYDERKSILQMTRYRIMYTTVNIFSIHIVHEVFSIFNQNRK